MHYLVTGANGFIGSYVVEELLKNPSNRVTALIRASSNLFRLETSKKKIHFLSCDMENRSLLFSSLDKDPPKKILHLAWEGVENKYRNQNIQINNQKFLDLILDLSIKFEVSNLVALGSQAEYGIKNRQIKEDEFLNPTTLYGKEKMNAFLKLREVCDMHNICYQWLRLFSCYGPMDNSSWLIPYVISQFLKSQRPLLTSGIQKWDYLFVEDVARGIIKSSFLQECGVFNLGSGESVTIKEIVTKIYEYLDPKVDLVFGELPFREDQIFHLQADISLLKVKTGWEPQVSLENGLKMTTRYHQNQTLAFC